MLLFYIFGSVVFKFLVILIKCRGPGSGYTQQTQGRSVIEKKCTVAARNTEKFSLVRCTYVSVFVFAVYHEIIRFKMKLIQK